MGNLYSVFLNEYLNEKNEWVFEYNFYMGDLSNVDLKTDWRFKEVDGKRKQVEFLGTCHTTFPIVFPLELNNGTLIETLWK